MQRAAAQYTSQSIHGLARRHPIAAAALLMAMGLGATAHADQLAVVSDSTITLVEETAPSTPIRTLSFTLPEGFVGGSVLGADLNAADGTITLGIRDSEGGNCAFVIATVPATGDVATINPAPVRLSDTCAATPPSGDIETVAARVVDSTLEVPLVYNGTAYSAAASRLIYNVFVPTTPPGPPADQGITVTRVDSEGTADVVAVTFNSFDTSAPTAQPVYGIDGASNALVQLTYAEITTAGRPATANETIIGSLGVSVSGATSFDQKPDGSRFYLATAGALYTVNISNGGATSLGALPEGTRAVTWFGPSVTPPNPTGLAGGAVDGVLAFGLFGALALRRRSSRRKDEAGKAG